jgi:hypothetical protein
MANQEWGNNFPLDDNGKEWSRMDKNGHEWKSGRVEPNLTIMYNNGQAATSSDKHSQF